MKLIALDVGTKRIGVAKADSKVRIAIPYSAIEVNGEEFKKIASLARAWDIDNFVLGLPRNSQGEETKQSLYVRKFAKHLKAAIPSAKICFQDESLTSVEAEKRLSSRKKGYKKGDIDSEAATIILQDFLEEKTGKTTTRAAAARSKSVRGVRPHRVLTALFIGLILLGLSVAGAVVYYNYNLRPVNEDSEVSTLFTVESGQGIAEVATNLQTAGLIRNNIVFQIYFRLNSGDEMLKAGEYDLNPAMTAEKIAGLLLRGSDSVYSFTVFPGQTVADIREELIAHGYAAAEVDAALAKDYRGESFGWIFNGMPAEATSPEGYLYGDTYEFFRDDSAETVIRRLLTETASVLEKQKLADKFAEQGLNLYQGITLASVVQREADTADDMAQVAQVFFNRLNHPEAETRGLLGSDVTAQYAANLADPERTIYTDNAAVVEIDSPYNTRKYPGLPYGPISNPGYDALSAVANPDPAVAGMYYFLAGDDGKTYFAADFNTHQYNINTYCQTLCAVSL